MARPTGDEATTMYRHPERLLQKLIRFDTTNPPGNEAACITYVRDLLDAAGVRTTLLAKDPNRPNLIARLPGRGQAAPILLQGHVDVVTTEGQTWQHPPFAGVVVDGYVWGRGALDMKGGVAMMVAAFLRAKLEGLRPPGDVVLAVLSDEEARGGCGAQYLVEQHPDAFEGIRFAIGEFGGSTFHLGDKRFYPIQVSEKQGCDLMATTTDAGGHGTLAMRGSAMACVGHALVQLDQQRLPAHITPISRIMLEIFHQNLPQPISSLLAQMLDPQLTGPALDQIGPLAEVIEPMLCNRALCSEIKGNRKRVEMKLCGVILPGCTVDTLLDELREVMGPGFDLEVTRVGEPSSADPDMGLFDTLADILREMDPGSVPCPMVMPAVTDGRFFARLGIQTYGFTPMRLPPGFHFWRTIHGPDERIPVEAVSFGAQAIYRLLQRFGP
jgi:acetylornithine deacetylase/succinyl-diaminopimelate desuccinylase-like protein